MSDKTEQQDETLSKPVRTPRTPKQASRDWIDQSFQGAMESAKEAQLRNQAAKK